MSLYRNGKDSTLLNMDGFRLGGPAGGPSHRLMDSNNPDKLVIQNLSLIILLKF
jgi:hypothetical protein